MDQRRAAGLHPATAAAAVKGGQKKRPSIRSRAYFAATFAEMQKVGRDAREEYDSLLTVELLSPALEAVGAKHCCRRTSAQMNKA